MTQVKLHAIITCLHKKGLFNIAKNLSIRANMSRILAKIVKSRLSMIVQVNVVLNMTVVVHSDRHFSTCAVVIFRVKVSCITPVDGIKLWLLT